MYAHHGIGYWDPWSPKQALDANLFNTVWLWACQDLLDEILLSDHTHKISVLMGHVPTDEQVSPRVSLTWARQHAPQPQLNPPLQLCPFWSKQSAGLCIQQLWGLLKTQWSWTQGGREPSRPNEQGGRRRDNLCSQRGVSTQERKMSLASLSSAGKKVCLQLGNV